jgi:hypothetical protein
MPIQKLFPSRLEQCCAICGRVNVVRFDDIELGASAEGGARINKDVIRLPSCPGCGAVENLVRTWDDASGVLPAGHKLEHRKLVNRLAERLKATGRVNAGCAARIAEEKDEPPNIIPLDPADPDRAIDIGPPPWASGRQGQEAAREGEPR